MAVISTKMEKKIPGSQRLANKRDFMSDQYIQDKAMRSLFSNRYLDAFAKSIVVFGILHIIILIILAIRDGLHTLNIFAILGLHLFIPGLGEGLASFILSYCLALGVYGFVFLFMTDETK